MTERSPPTEAPDKDTREPVYAVVMLNDDATPMEFVVDVLEGIFEMDRETALRIMLHIHNNGAGECGRYGHEEATAKVTEVLGLAREHGHPLHCAVERSV
jgi:ATP-dependent Clp protease adaptor protein ClpS